MNAKALDKCTKAELLALLGTSMAAAREADCALTQARADIQRLKSDLTALENRRRFENQAYRSKSRTSEAPRPADMRELAREYCAEHGVRSATQAELQAYHAARSS